MESEKTKSEPSEKRSTVGDDGATVVSQDDQNKPYRYHSLSKPKIYHYQQTKWLTNGVSAKWGTQEMLTPPSQPAMQALASPRVEQLARAKLDRQEYPAVPIFLYSCGRDSQINLVSKGAKSAACSPRVEQLAKHKEAPQEFTDLPHKDQFTYSCGRSSPIWPVDQRAQTAGERPRTNTLAKHKEYHRDYKPERELPWDVSKTVQRASCSERLSSLSAPKIRREDQFRSPRWEVSLSTRKANATPRTLELSRYKPIYDGYAFNYDQGLGYEKLPRVIRDITRNTKNAVASTRTKELSIPIIRQSMDLVQFDPEAFIIKPNALNAFCSNRIAELATPIAR